MRKRKFIIPITERSEEEVNEIVRRIFKDFKKKPPFPSGDIKLPDNKKK